MKTFILTLLIIFSTQSLLPADESAKPKQDEVVKVRISEETTELPQTDSLKENLPEVEIKVVEEVNIVPAGSKTTVQDPLLAVSANKKITATQPDNNLVIYFILLMVIVVGIMALASIIPGPSSTRTDK